MTRRESQLEQRDHDTTPLEMHLLQRYTPMLTAVQQWLQRLQQQRNGNGRLSMKKYEQAMDQALTPDISIDDFQAAAEVLQRHQLIQLGDDAIHLTEVQSLSLEVIQELIVAFVRRLDIPQGTVAEAVALLAECRTTQKSQRIIPVDAKRVGLAKILDAAGLISLTAVHFHNATITLPHQRSLDAASEEMAIFTIMALQQSSDEPGITAGWNKLLIPGALVYNNPIKYLPHLAQRGCLLPASAKAPHQQDEFFFNVNDQVGKIWRQSNQYEQWIRQHRFREEAMRTAMSQAFIHPAAVTLPDVPDTVRLLPQAALEAVFNMAGTKDLQAAIKLGYCLPAADFNRYIYKKASRNRIKHRRHYFVGKDLAALRAWSNMPAYHQWIDQHQLRTWLIQHWVELMQRGSYEQPAFVPTEFQPAYVVSERDIDQAHPMQFDPHYLSTLGHLLFLHSSYYLFWPDAKKGLAYRQQQKQLYSQDSVVKRQQEQSLFTWRIQQCFAAEDWPSPPDYITVPPEFTAVHILPYEQLQQRLAALPPLTVSQLKRRNYVLDAQSSIARPGVGLLIACPGGAAQLTAIQQSTWYATLLTQQRQRGLDQLKLSSQRRRKL